MVSNLFNIIHAKDAYLIVRKQLIILMMFIHNQAQRKLFVLCKPLVIGLYGVSKIPMLDIRDTDTNK